MNISYTEPLSRAWNRMKGMLFRPFHIESWFVLGFSAFLAGLFKHTGSVANWNSGWKSGRHHEVDTGTEWALDQARDLTLRLLENPAVLAAIIAGLLVFAVLLLVLAWVSARSEFVFLDNVALRRAHFTEPWRRLGRLGHSLFLWRAVFSLAYLPPIAIITLPFVNTFLSYLRGDGLALPSIATMVLGISLGVLLLLLIAWVSLIMDSFVVPLMYRYDERALQAWARFWPLLTGRLGSFIAFTVFLVVLAIAVGIGLVIAGVGTCCVGLVLMLIPYIGSVVLLPVSVTARALGPEFLAQFGPEWTTFPADADEDEPEPRPVL